GALYEGLRNRKAENLGGLEVDHQFKLGWLLDGKIGGLRALQDPVDIDGCPMGHIGEGWSLRHEAAGGNVLAGFEYWREPIFARGDLRFTLGRGGDGVWGRD